MEGNQYLKAALDYHLLLIVTENIRDERRSSLGMQAKCLQSRVKVWCDLFGRKKDRISVVERSVVRNEAFNILDLRRSQTR